MKSFIEENANKIALPNSFLRGVREAIACSAPVEEIYIFGSYARGEQRTDSDVDVYTVFSDGIESLIHPAGSCIEALSPIFRQRGLSFDLAGKTAVDHLKMRNQFAMIPCIASREGVKLYG